MILHPQRNPLVVINGHWVECRFGLRNPPATTEATTPSPHQQRQRVCFLVQVLCCESWDRQRRLGCRGRCGRFYRDTSIRRTTAATNNSDCTCQTGRSGLVYHPSNVSHSPPRGTRQQPKTAAIAKTTGIAVRCRSPYFLQGISSRFRTR